MTTDVLTKINTLSPDKQQEVEDFVDYLINKYGSSGIDEASIIEKRKKNLGWAKGQIWMAEDFNDTPEDFKDYM